MRLCKGRVAVILSLALIVFTGGLYAQTGSLKVDTHHSDLNARWKIKDTSTWYEDEYTLSGLTPGQYTVEFEDIADYEKPGDKIAEVKAGETTVVHGTYIATKGALKVDTHPSDLYAGWRFEGMSAWYQDGHTETGLEPGTYTIEFEPISGWKEPDPKQVVVEAGKTETVHADYLEGDGTTGALKVDTHPSGKSGGWRLQGMSTWWPDEHTEKGLLPGQYTVEFEPVDGWTEPQPRTVKVEIGKTTVVHADYLEGDGTTGAIKGDTHPTGKSGGWRLSGMSSWFADGHTESGLLPGQYTVEFEPVSGYLTPAPQTVTVKIGKTTVVHADYVEGDSSTATLVVDTHHSGLNAGWRLTSDGIWREDEEVVTGLAPGSYTIELELIEGHIAPENIQVSLQAGTYKVVHYTYVKGENKGKGALKVHINPNDAKKNGAAYSITRDGNTSWHASGEKIENLSPGTYRIGFNKLRGWQEPEPVDVTVKGNETAVHHADYKQIIPEPLVRSFYAEHKTIVYGDTTTLHWKVEDADNVTITGIGDNLPRSGSEIVGPSQDTVYTLTARSDAGEATAETSVHVVEKAAVLYFYGDHDKENPVSKGTKSTLHGAVRGAQEVQLIERDTSKVIRTWKGDGSFTCDVRPESTTTYRLVVESAGDTVYADVLLPVTNIPVIDLFTVNKPYVDGIDEQVIFTWKVRGATSMKLLPGIGSISNITDTEGKKIVFIKKLGTYTLLASNSFGTVEKKVTISLDNGKKLPDLKLSLGNGTSAPSAMSVRKGQIIEVPFTVKNIGKARGRKFDVQVAGNGIVNNTVTVDKHLKPGQSYNGKLYMVPMKQGNLSAKVMVDPEYRVGEKSLVNNQATIELKTTQQKGRDLAITGFTVNKVTTTQSGTWAEISYTVSNVGTLRASLVQSRVTLNNTLLVDNFCEVIKAGKSVSYTHVVKVDTSKSVLRFRFILDPFGAHSEIAKDNNRIFHFIKRKDF